MRLRDLADDVEEALRLGLPHRAKPKWSGRTLRAKAENRRVALLAHAAGVTLGEARRLIQEATTNDKDD